MSRIWMAFVLILVTNLHTLAQTQVQPKIDFNTAGKTYVSLLNEIKESYGIRIYFKQEFFTEEVVKREYKGQTVQKALQDIADVRELDLVSTDSKTYFFTYKGEVQAISTSDDQVVSEDADIEISSPDGLKKQLCTLSGVITDAKDGLPIIGGYVTNFDKSIGTVTDVNGNFQLNLPAGKHKIIISALGYVDDVKTINISYDGRLNIELFESVIKLSDIVITAERDNENVLNTKMGADIMSIDALKKLPSLMGEADIVKSVELLPGVTSVGEGSQGFNVRGGGSDQNLVLLNGSPVFNYSHFLGFFSAFNPDVVRDVGFYRGYIPAEYGGRISSVLDIALRDGNYKQFSGKGGISLANSSVLVEGPIQKDSTSFYLAARGTYSDWLLNSFSNPNVKASSANFYDINAKVTHKIDWSKQISANYYLSQDKFNFLNDTIYNWQTQAINLEYQQAINSRISLQSNINKSEYSYLVQEEDEGLDFDLKYQIDYYVTNHHISYDHPMFSATAGVQGTYYDINRGELIGGENSQVNDFKIAGTKALDLGAFVQAETQSIKNFRFSGGLRLSNFTKIGTETIYEYDPNAPKSADTIIDSLEVDGKKEKAFYGLEPRFGLTYILGENSSFKMSFTRTYQYIHLLSNTTSITPLDIWETSGYHIKPQIGNQYSAGIYQNFKNNRYETSVEVYYKQLNNVLEYKNGANLILNPRIETDLLQGRGAAYGAEFYAKKNTGKLTGWLSYTYSRSFNRINSEFQEERISGGNWFPSNFDKPHNLKLFGSYKFNHRVTLNWNFQYSTGRPITVPLSKYQIDNVVVKNFSERNSYRIPDYHRLDIAVDIFPNHKIQKVFESYWTIGVYNVYFRENAYSVFFEDSGTDPLAKQLSVLGSIFPSISYNFKF